MKSSRGEVHDYLGMKLDFTCKGKVKVNMVEYTKEIIKDFVDIITGGAAIPAASHLFDVNDKGKLLVEDLAREFHTTVAKLLFLCKRARPDIQVPVAFLTTRVREPQMDDWKKLVRVLKYLNDTVDMVLTLSANSLTKINLVG